MLIVDRVVITSTSTSVLLLEYMKTHSSIMTSHHQGISVLTCCLGIITSILVETTESSRAYFAFMHTVRVRLQKI